jgi:hypothetical protein
MTLMNNYHMSPLLNNPPQVMEVAIFCPSRSRAKQNRPGSFLPGLSNPGKWP